MFKNYLYGQYRCWLFLVGWAVVGCVHAQQYTISALSSINTPKDEVVCTWMEDAMVVSTNSNDLALHTKDSKSIVHFNLGAYTKGENLKQFYPPYLFMGAMAEADEGTASYSAQDSMLYFSSAVNYGKTTGKKLKLYRRKWDGKTWSNPELLPFCNSQYDYAHPCFDSERKLLVFSSNMPGGKGQMDIWFAYSIGQTEFTEPVNLPFPVNTATNETFPTIYQGDIYYASIRNGMDYDLFCTKEKEQWEKTEPLGQGLNTEYNDLRILFLNEEKGYLSSTRPGGAGGCDVFFFQREKTKEQTHAFSARLVCSGEPLPYANINAYDELQEQVLSATTDEQGKLNISELNLRGSYTLRLTNVPVALWSKCQLHLLDERNRIVRTYRFNAKGELVLELLPFDYSDLQLLPNPDYSRLTIDVAGQVYAEAPGDLGEGETITVIDDQGNMIAVAQTNQTGNFTLSKLFPELSYTFKLSEQSKATQVAITDNGKAIVLPVLKEEAIYRTAAMDEPIELINENHETILLHAQDLHVINRIYYNHSSADLSTEAKDQLQHLAMLLKENPGMNLQLEAHTDATGDEVSNLKLSELRANVALQYLADLGIDRARMKAIALGESQPLNTCSEVHACNEALHAINRRTELKLLLK